MPKVTKTHTLESLFAQLKEAVRREVIADLSLALHGVQGNGKPMSKKSAKASSLAGRALGRAQKKAMAVLDGASHTASEVQAKLKSKSPVYSLLNGLMNRGLVKKTGGKYSKA